MREQVFVLDDDSSSCSPSCNSFHGWTDGVFPYATGTVLKVICKAIEQDLRRVILSKEGFQQVQVQAITTTSTTNICDALFSQCSALPCQVDVEVLQLAASAHVMDIAVVSDIQSLLDAVMVRDTQYCHDTH